MFASVEHMRTENITSADQGPELGAGISDLVFSTFCSPKIFWRKDAIAYASLYAPA
jgi:hypothetical protein